MSPMERGPDQCFLALLPGNKPKAMALCGLVGIKIVGSPRKEPAPNTRLGGGRKQAAS